LIRVLSLILLLALSSYLL